MIRIQIVISRKTISISEENHSELTKLGVSGETIDDISKREYVFTVCTALELYEFEKTKNKLLIK